MISLHDFPDESKLESYLRISGSEQFLSLIIAGEVKFSYPISTGANGFGEEDGSGKTPRGWHRIAFMYGDNCSDLTNFVGRREDLIFDPDVVDSESRDWILARIMWLSGLEDGKNRGVGCDTLARYIYLHGSPDYRVAGIPRSKGCINLKTKDIVELYSYCYIGMRVKIDG